MSAAPFDVDAPTLPQGAAVLSALYAALDQRADLDARIIDLTAQVQSSGTVETIEGMPLEMVLAQTHRLTQADRGMLLTAADVLRDMPATLALLVARVLSFSQVRGIVAEAKRLTRDERAELDGRIDASRDMYAKWDPDDVVDAVRVDAADVRDPASVERREKALERGNFFWVQPGLLDRGKVYGELDNVALASVATAVDAMAPAEDGRSLSQRRADGLVALARHRCDDPAEPDPVDAEDRDDADADAEADGEVDGEGANGEEPGAASQTGRRTRHPRLHKALPDVTVLIDWREITPAAAGMLTINAPGCVPTISAALLEALVADGATVRAIITDGAQPLFVSRKIYAAQIPTDIRRAIKARDRKDRFPGSRRPIEHLHHAEIDGGHDLNAIVGLSHRSHRRVHRHGWKISLDPPTGEITFTRGERSWTTLPRGLRLRRPPPPDDS
jgi:hypothetical protein